MKLKVYGYFNYGNVHDQKEHITATPIKDIDGWESRDYSGNEYEFELDGKMRLEYGKSSEEDYLVDREKTLWNVVSRNGCCYLCTEEFVHESKGINLGNLKAHKI